MMAMILARTFDTLTVQSKRVVNPSKARAQGVCFRMYEGTGADGIFGGGRRGGLDLCWIASESDCRRPRGEDTRREL